MSEVTWMLKGRQFSHCNCAYGCPCQFNALPTKGFCQAIIGVDIEKGRHGDTQLDGLRFAAIAAWPGPIHEGKGQIVPIVDERATPAQREALLRIMSGQDTEPGATIFQVFSTVLETVHPPVFTPIDFAVDVEGRRASLRVPGMLDARGEPIVNPISGQEFRGRIDLPGGFEYTRAEVGRGWCQTSGPIALHLEDSHAHFATLHMTQNGVVQ